MATASPVAAGRWRLAILAAALFLGAAYFYQDPEWNGNSRLDLTRAIVEQGTLRIDAYHDASGWATGDKSFFDGHYYSDKAIGTSILAAPFYFVAYRLSMALGFVLNSADTKHLLTTIVMGMTFTMAGLVTYLIAGRITASPIKSLLATLAVSFGTMLWPYSAVFYGHVPAAAFLVLAFYLMFTAVEPPAGHFRSHWLWAGFALGMAFIADYTSAFIIVGLGIYALYVVRRLTLPNKIRAAASGALGAIIPLLLMFAYNLMVYRTPLAFGYDYEVEDRFQKIMGLGLMGMRFPTLSATYHITFDPKFGAFWLSPVLLLAPIGYLMAFKSRRFRAESLISIYAIAVMFGMNAASFLWWGGSTFGPRLIISALPFFVVPLALLPDVLLWPTGILAVISGANMLVPLMGQIQYTKLEYKPDRGGFFIADTPFHGFSLLYDYGVPQILRQLEAGRPSWMLGTAVGLPYWLSVPALLVAEAALLTGLAKRSPSPSSGQRLEPASTKPDSLPAAGPPR